MNTDRVVTNVYTLFSLGFELDVAMSNSLISTQAEVTTLHEERSTLRTRYSSVILKWSCVPHRGYIPFWYDLQGVGVAYWEWVWFSGVRVAHRYCAPTQLVKELDTLLKKAKRKPQAEGEEGSSQVAQRSLCHCISINN